MDDFSYRILLYFGILIVSVFVIVTFVPQSETPISAEKEFCPDYFVRGSGFVGYDYYCPMGDEVKEFLCEEDQCYWLVTRELES